MLSSGLWPSNCVHGGDWADRRDHGLVELSPQLVSASHAGKMLSAGWMQEHASDSLGFLLNDLLFLQWPWQSPLQSAELLEYNILHFLAYNEEYSSY